MTRILVADDEENILYVLGRAISARHHEVETASTVEDARRIVETSDPDLLIADLRLSLGDGREGLQLIEFAKARNPATQVILMTAHGSPEIEREAYRAGASFYLEKPIDLRTLLDRLSRLEAGAGKPVPAAVAPPAPVTARPETTGSPRGKKILLVDDSRTSLFLQHTILRKGAYAIVTASDGLEAVAKAESERPDLIVMDVVMPRMDGLQALRRLREMDSTRDIPVILVTTRGEAPNVEAGYALGCDAYVTKPVDAVELLSKVQTFVGAP